eukprot:TRINITY_DN6962_c0_g1_i2.p1 TRINITY_DN6962_c0_g1~~TRINITY_DN6962_c0_g1_i2.p1  ORF type:complete len:638 (-),score=117.86 TRINITY_DN6962_c0_g1_i2:26-1939(-)
MVGDLADLPVIKFVSSSEVDQRVLDALGPWFPDVNQNNFYRSIRHFVIDMLDCNKCTGIHWQVSQSTSLSDIVFKMGPKSQGLWMENGSGGFIADLVFEGGMYGMWVGNQQFTSRNISISNASEAGVYLNWDWAWTFKNLRVYNSTVGVSTGGGTGSLTLIDSTFDNCGVGIVTHFSEGGNGQNSLLLDNLLVTTREQHGTVLVDSNKTLIQVQQGTTVIQSWAQGHVWKSGGNTIEQQDFSSYAPSRPKSLAPRAHPAADNFYFEKSRPEFPNTVDVSKLGVIGDGKTDTTTAFRVAIQFSLQNNKSMYFPHGIYLISDTIVIPSGINIVGEAWSVFMASGSAFQDEQNPRPMIQVGEPGDIGGVQLAGLLFSTRGPQPGAILLQWNMLDPVGESGANGMWEVHFRVGGAIGTGINDVDCPSGTTAPASKCTGAWALMHVAAGSVYMENVWGWVADHDLDTHKQLNVYNPRGFLCESSGPVWMYGTAFEHSALYQYNFHGASNVFLGMGQTETPYYQPSTSTPFNPSAPTDPTYCTDDVRCQMALALNIERSENIFLYGLGFYSFFNSWSQDCLKSSPPSCQLDLVKIRNSHRIFLHSLNTYGSVNMLTSEEKYSLAGSNKNTFCATAILDLNLYK